MRLPASVQEIADVIGRERALYLIGQLPRCYAGKEGHKSSRVILYVPTAKRIPADHYLVRILGWQDAMKMCQAFGGEILQPANCSEIYRRHRDKTIMAMLQAGAKASAVAAVMGVTERQVRMIRAAHMENPQEEVPPAANDNAPTTGKRAHA